LRTSRAFLCLPRRRPQSGPSALRQAAATIILLSSWAAKTSSRKCELLKEMQICNAYIHFQASNIFDMYAHMLEMQERNAVLEETIGQQAGQLRLHEQLRSTQANASHTAQPALPLHPESGNSDDDDAHYSSSDGFESSSAGEEHSVENEEGGDDEDESQGANTGKSSGSAHVDTTDALAGAAREALRIDPNSGDAAANAFRLQNLLKSCIRRMLAQEQLLQAALNAPAATPGKSKDDIARLQDALVTAVAVAQSFIHDNAMMQADHAEKDAQVARALQFITQRTSLSAYHLQPASCTRVG
jgi:hypothetical protein